MEVLDKKDDMPAVNQGELKKITIVLSGTDRKIMNRFSREFYDFIQKFDPSVEQPLILPISEAVFTTRKSPCGNGTATFSKHTLKVSQREFNFSVYEGDLKKVADFLKSSSVDAQLKINP